MLSSLGTKRKLIVIIQSRYDTRDWVTSPKGEIERRVLQNLNLLYFIDFDICVNRIKRKQISPWGNGTTLRAWGAQPYFLGLIPPWQSAWCVNGRNRLQPPHSHPLGAASPSATSPLYHPDLPY